MSTKVTIAFEHTYEMETIIKALKPLTKSYKVKVGKAPYKHVYLEMKEIKKNTN